MLFSNKKQDHSHPDINITIQNENIQHEKTIKYLGITLSEEETKPLMHFHLQMCKFYTIN